MELIKSTMRGKSVGSTAVVACAKRAVSYCRNICFHNINNRKYRWESIEFIIFFTVFTVGFRAAREPRSVFTDFQRRPAPPVVRDLIIREYSRRSLATL